jgi:hypothetical protein
MHSLEKYWISRAAGMFLLRLLEIGLELIESSGEALTQGIAHAFKGFPLCFGCVNRAAPKIERGFAVSLCQCESVEDLKRPGRTEGRASNAAIGVGERVDEDELFGSNDVTINKSAHISWPG